jgi:hypothetical protein
MKPINKFPIVLALCLAIVAVFAAAPANAQCGTCATPVVAYSPVVAPTTTVMYQPADTGWYPGKLLDTWRMRRWGYTAPTAVTTSYAPTYSVGYAPTYTAAYAPAYTAAYGPSYTAAYAPYSVSYAPAVTTTNYSMPYVTSYAPLGQRRVLMRPVVVESPVMAAAPVISSGCSTCSACEVAAPCSSCAATTVVEQATYAAAPAPCSSCAQGSTITYADQPAATSTGQTGQPAMTPEEAARARANYPDETAPKNSQYPQDPGPAPPEETEEKAGDSSSYFEAPALFIPGDRTARQETVKPANRAPSVDVWNAVYRGPVNNDSVSTTSFKSTARTQAEIDAEGWSSVPAN